MKILICPRQAFTVYIVEQVYRWNKEGYQILLMGDLNEYIYSQSSRSFFSRIGLREFIIYKDRSGRPSSTISNKKNQAIDRIWGFTCLTTTECVYLPFHRGIRYDHRSIWIKDSSTNSFGSKLTPSKFPSSQKLRLNHPRG